MGPIKVFLDANILFSAALGGASFALLWELAGAGRLVLLTSRYCRLEAERNLARKRPEALERFASLLEQVAEVPEARDEITNVELPAKDRPVYETALAYKADVLLTGDTTHFKHLMERGDLPLRVRTVRAFLLENR